MTSMATWAPIVRAMPLSEAEDIYETKYAKFCHFDELEPGKDCVIFDYEVNSGPGRIVKVLVAENQDVRADEGLLIIEAMKMQNELRAPRAGRVERIYVAEGAGVETGLKLLRLS